MNKDKTYTPELGQAFFGCSWNKYIVPEYAEALFFGVWTEIARVFWNVNQREFDSRGGDDPKIEGFEVRPYWWGDEGAPEAALPNFVFGEVEICWYKYPGRGMSTNVDWDPARWVAWFDSALVVVRAHEEKWNAARGARRNEPE